MKKILRQSIWFLSVALFAFLAGPVQAQDCEKRILIRVSDDFLPFSKLGADNEYFGIDVDLTRKVMDIVGCPYKLMTMVWKRSLLMIELGHLDMMIFASVTPERLKYAHFSVPYRNDIAGMVIRRADKNRFQINSPEDILRHGMNVGHFKDTYRGEGFASIVDRLIAEERLFYMTKMRQGLRMLEVGRIDAVVALPAAALSKADDLGLSDQIDIHPYILMSDPVHIMASKKTVSKELLDRINAAILTVQRSSKYKEAFGRMGINPD